MPNISVIRVLKAITRTPWLYVCVNLTAAGWHGKRIAFSCAKAALRAVLLDSPRGFGQLAFMVAQRELESKGSGGSIERQLTQAGLVRMELVPPPPAVAPYVTTFFRLRCDEIDIRDVQPSSLGIIALMARGSGQIRFLDGRAEPSHRFSLLTPSNAAATFEVTGPWDVFGAMLSPMGWAGLTGLSATLHGNRLVEGHSVLPQTLTAACHEILQDFDQLESSQMAQRLADGVEGALRPLPLAHTQFLAAVAEWLAQSLSPEIDDLYARAEYGPRQVQRLTERYFGLPPRSLARKYRALRAAVILSRPSLTADEIAAVQDHFYDQPHMIREIRLFAGRTPARIADPDTPYLSAFLDLRYFREKGPRMAPIPDDLRA